MKNLSSQMQKIGQDVCEMEKLADVNKLHGHVLDSIGGGVHFCKIEIVIDF